MTLFFFLEVGHHLQRVRHHVLQFRRPATLDPFYTRSSFYFIRVSNQRTDRGARQSAQNNQFFVSTNAADTTAGLNRLTNNSNGAAHVVTKESAAVSHVDVRRQILSDRVSGTGYQLYMQRPAFTQPTSLAAQVLIIGVAFNKLSQLRFDDHAKAVAKPCTFRIRALHHIRIAFTLMSHIVLPLPAASFP